VIGRGTLPDIEEALDRIRFQLEHAEAFWFGLVAGNDQVARDALRTAVEAGLGERGKTLEAHRLDPQAVEATVVDLLERMNRSDGADLHWIVVGGPDEPTEIWDRAAGRLFAALNERREAFRHRAAGGLVVEGREGLKRTLRTMGPDLFSIRSFIVEPRSDAGWDEGGGSSPLVELEEEVLEADPDREIERLVRIPGKGAGRGARRARLAAQQRAIDGLLAVGRMAEASTLVDESNALVRDLTQEDPDDPWLSSARFLSHIQRGRLALDTGPLAAAAAQFGTALALAEAEPPSSRRLRRIRTAHDGLAAVASDTGDLDAGVLHGKAALEAARQGSEEVADDRERLRTLAIAHNKLGDLLVSAGRRRDARLAFRLSFAIRRRMVQGDSPHPVFRRDLSICHDKLGDLAALNGDLADAERHYRHSLDLRQILVQERPNGPRADKARRDLAAVHARLGVLARRSGDGASAARRIRLAVDLLRELDVQDPNRVGVTTDLVSITGVLGDLARERDDMGKALVHQDEALRLAGGLASSDLGSVRRLGPLAAAHERLGDLLWEMEDFEEAETHLDAALDVRTRIALIRPDGPRAARALAAVHLRLQRVAEAFGRDDEAIRHRDAATTEVSRAESLRVPVR
jgi:tetratricopeptide (TPR) repeat protein